MVKELFKDFKNSIVKNYKILLILLFSLVATAGIVGIYKIIYTDNFLTNSFINIIIFILFLFVYKKQSELNKKEKIFSVIFSMFLSIIIVIGTQLEYNSEIEWNLITILKIVCLNFSFYPIINIIISFINKSNLTTFKNLNYKKLFIITFLIILLLDSLVFLAIYPGLYGYDAGYQIMQILEDVQLTSHFSLLYSFILAKTVELGKILFNSYNVGFAIYSFLQMLFLAFVASKITLYSVKKAKNIYLYIFCLIFFGIFPMYTIMVLSATQDTIFAGIFALVILNILDMVENKDYWKHKIKPVILILLLLLLCMIRNNGFYVVLVTIPFIFAFIKNKKLLTVILFIIPLCLYKVYTGPIYNILNVVEGDTTREMLSIPSQQLARVYNYNISAFDVLEIEKLNKYYTKLEDFKYYTYRQSISDPIKGVMDNNAVSKDLKGYLVLWTKVGMKDPQNYVEAFLLNSLGFWYPNKNYKDERMYHPYIEYEMMDGKFYNEKYLDIKKNSKFPAYEKLLNNLINNNEWKKLPIISTLFTIGTYFIVFCFLVTMVILRKNWQYLVPIALVLGLYITLLLSPVALFRYCFPIVILLPIFLSLILSQKNE